MAGEGIEVLLAVESGNEVIMGILVGDVATGIDVPLVRGEGIVAIFPVGGCVGNRVDACGIEMDGPAAGV